MSRRLVVVMLIVVFALTGCATTPYPLRTAGFGAAVGGVATRSWEGAAIGAGAGAVYGLLTWPLSGGLFTNEVGRRISEYCSSAYAPISRDYHACAAGAYGNRDFFRSGSGSSGGRSGGFAAGEEDRLRAAWKEGNQFGYTLGRAFSR
jgi:hypothetical protein